MGQRSQQGTRGAQAGAGGSLGRERWASDSAVCVENHTFSPLDVGRGRPECVVRP